MNSQPEPANLIGLRWWAQRAATLNIHAAIEHLKGVRTVLAGDELLPLPAMALARSVYEAVVNTCWLIDVEVSTEQRLARWAGRLLHDCQETGSLAHFDAWTDPRDHYEPTTEAYSPYPNAVLSWVEYLPGTRRLQTWNQAQHPVPSRPPSACADAPTIETS